MTSISKSCIELRGWTNLYNQTTFRHKPLRENIYDFFNHKRHSPYLPKEMRFRIHLYRMKNSVFLSTVSKSLK